MVRYQRITMIKTLLLCAAIIAGVAAVLEGPQKTCWSAHNALRALHKRTNRVRYDENLAEAAQKWAEYLAKRGVKYEDKAVAHRVGENIYVGIAGQKVSCAEAVLAWYDEIHDWDFKKNKAKSFSAETRHFTQLVWADSYRIGVGYATAERYGKTETYVVTRYVRKGNVDGKYPANVNDRIDGAITPTLEELDPDTKTKCENKFEACDSLLDYLQKPVLEFCKTYNDFCKKTCKNC